MKRKKLNFDIMNRSLKRSELREITAGCGSSGGGSGGGNCVNVCQWIAQQCAAAVCYGSCGSMATCNQQLNCCTRQCYELPC